MHSLGLSSLLKVVGQRLERTDCECFDTLVELICCSREFLRIVAHRLLALACLQDLYGIAPFVRALANTEAFTAIVVEHGARLALSAVCGADRAHPFRPF